MPRVARCLRDRSSSTRATPARPGPRPASARGCALQLLPRKHTDAVDPRRPNSCLNGAAPRAMRAPAVARQPTDLDPIVAAGNRVGVGLTHAIPEETRNDLVAVG